MATIDRDLILNGVKSWLPPYNVVSDADMLILIEQVISVVGDDDINTAQVQCESLYSIIMKNKFLATVSNGGGIKREKTYMEEVEYYDSNVENPWDSLASQIQDICPIAFGWYGFASKSAAGVRINVPDPIRVPKGSTSYGRTECNHCHQYQCGCDRWCRR